MAGHSKWANIKHRKAKQDAAKGKVFTKIIRELVSAAKQGDPDPASNPRLRAAVEKANSVNMTKDTVKRAIERGAGGGDNDNMQEITYEGYGLGGAAIMVDCMTDNKQRTVAEVRHAFSRFGGNMGAEGAVAFQFKHCGQLVFAPGTDEDKLMEAALEAGAEDVIVDDDGAIEVLTSPAEFEAVKNALEAANFKAEVAEVTMRADNTVQVTGEDAVKMQKLLDALEDMDDTQEVYHNAEMSE